MSDNSRVISPVEQQQQLSTAEGKDLAKVLGSDGGEQKVRARLLNDAYDSNHGKFNIETIKKTIIEEVNKEHLPGLVLKEDAQGNVYKQGTVVPFLNMELNNVSLFDREKADEYVKHMNEQATPTKIEQANSNAIDTRRVDIFGAVENIGKLFGKIYSAGSDK